MSRPPSAAPTAPSRIDPAELARKSLDGVLLSRAEAAAVLRWPEEDFPALLAAAYNVRRASFGRRVKLNYLANIQSGVCPEDCGYCSQSKVSDAPIEKYRLLPGESVLEAAERAVAAKAARLCLVASGRGPSDGDVRAVAAAVEDVKRRFPGLEVCCCLGLLKDGQAGALKEAGVDAYNHNLNTSERHYKEICGTHTHADRVDTVKRAQAEGLSSCSGALFGMGETDEDVLDVAYRLRELDADSIPVNFLIPIRGTPLAEKDELTPVHCLRILCLFRLLNPRAELRIAGGREVHLRGLQPLGLLVANSIFVGDYLTTEGQPASADVEMIRDLGFEILGETPGGPADRPRAADRVKLVSRRKTSRA
jgi:biotin synthase